MEHHDLAHRRLRIWPMDQTSLGHHHLCCAIHHKQAPRAHSAHRLHKNCGQSFGCSTYSIFLFFPFFVTYFSLSQKKTCLRRNEKIMIFLFNLPRCVCSHCSIAMMPTTLRCCCEATPCQGWAAAVPTCRSIHTCPELHLRMCVFTPPPDQRFAKAAYGSTDRKVLEKKIYSALLGFRRHWLCYVRN